MRMVVIGRAIGVALSRWWEDRTGNVAVMFALMSVALMLAIGAAIDMGRWLHARDQTLAAADAAVLAGGRSLQTNSDDAAAIDAAQKFYAQNVSSRIPVMNDSISFSVGESGTSVSAVGTAFIKTLFLQFASIDKLPLVPTSGAEFARAELAVGHSSSSGDFSSSNGNNDNENLEISMMLDITGSMAGQKLKDLKSAAEDLINIVVWDDQSEFTSRVALVPFSEDIRLPTDTARDLARGTGLPSNQDSHQRIGEQQAIKDLLSFGLRRRAHRH